ncbi:hypothetical protein VE04_08723 [Pseudogymnoascus sp. 24MN13]|nr:hypothetical protein VE04_08723 [Pseudogymnoascus sp. 24MN13]
MASQTLSTATSGLLFGAALSAAGVASPSIIISQLRLENFHMLEVFLTATAGSAAPPSRCARRSPAARGYFPYDGNIAGCLLLGAGMALTGSCPGTVLVQVGMGLRSGFAVLAGSLAGGALFVGYSAGFRRATPAAAKGEEKPKLTFAQRCGVAHFPAVLVYQAICLSVVGAALRYLPDEQGKLLNPLSGGSLMALAQLASLLLTTNTRGVSSAYESFGKLFWRARGVAGGSAAFWRLSGTFPAKGVEVGDAAAVVGGVLMAIGSRVAGGCTSGHGISGMAGLSVASFVSVVAMFGGGIAVALGGKFLGF